MKTDRYWHLKFALGSAITLVLLVTFGAGTPSPAPKRFDEKWSETVPQRQEVASVAQAVPLAPTPVPTLSVAPQAPLLATAPNLPAPPPPMSETVPPVPTRYVPPVYRDPPPRYRRYAGERTNVCARHGMRKVVTRSGRSWRCRRV